MAQRVTDLCLTAVPKLPSVREAGGVKSVRKRITGIS